MLKVILLDLRLPEIDGLEVLRQMRADSQMIVGGLVVSDWHFSDAPITSDFLITFCDAEHDPIPQSVEHQF